jgi:hypothetical protein
MKPLDELGERTVGAPCLSMTSTMIGFYLTMVDRDLCAIVDRWKCKEKHIAEAEGDNFLLDIWPSILLFAVSPMSTIFRFPAAAILIAFHYASGILKPYFVSIFSINFSSLAILKTSFRSVKYPVSTPFNAYFGV